MDDETTGRLPDDDSELTRVRPRTTPTRVMPAADEGETQVMPGADTGATRVMPAAGAAPSAAAQPADAADDARPRQRGRGLPWWVWLLVVLAVIAAAAALWYFYLRPTDATSAGEEFIGTWAPQSGAGGGLVINRPASSSRSPSTTTSSRRSAPPRPTSWTESSSSRAGLGHRADRRDRLRPGHADPRVRRDRLKLQFAAGDLTIEPVYFVRVEVLLPATPSPSPTASPSPTPSPTAVADDQPDREPVGLDHRRPGGRHRHRQAAGRHRRVGRGQQQPLSAAAGRRRRRRALPVREPLADQPVHRPADGAGTAPGNYVYEQLSGGQAYKLTGYLSDGLTYAVPEAAEPCARPRPRVRRSRRPPARGGAHSPSRWRARCSSASRRPASTPTRPTCGRAATPTCPRCPTRPAWTAPASRSRRPASRVYVTGSLSGTYAEYALCLEEDVQPLPDGLSYAQGAAARRALLHRLPRPVPAGRRGGRRAAAVHGASGGVGIATVQLALAAGLDVAGTAGSEAGSELVAARATCTCSTTATRPPRAGARAHRRRGFDLIIEFLANVNLGDDLTALAKRGRVVVVGSRGTVEVDARDLMNAEGAVLGMRTPNARPEKSSRPHARPWTPGCGAAC